MGQAINAGIKLPVRQARFAVDQSLFVGEFAGVARHHFAQKKSSSQRFLDCLFSLHGSPPYQIGRLDLCATGFTYF
jgi:hypothetical protein